MSSSHFTKIIRLKPHRDKALHRHHPWVFSQALDENCPDLKSVHQGELVRVESSEGEFLAYACYSPQSQIRLRNLSFDENKIPNSGLIKKRIQEAVSLREELRKQGCDGLRLVNSEGDYLPGLTVDQYNNVIVLCITSMAMEIYRDAIAECFQELFPDCLIFERSEGASRQKEGLPERIGMIAGSEDELPDTLYVKEYEEIYIPIDIKQGHKTGGYLDQRASRRYLKDLCAGKTVLNCFSYTGGFGLWALKGRAKSVINVDVSQKALDKAKAGVAFNHLDPGRCKFLCEDVFNYLRKARKNNLKFDIIILDPPKFAESAAQLPKACRGYQDINRLALELLAPGGRLLTFSCSGHMDLNLFQKVVADAALDARAQVRLLNVLRQDKDHPVALSCPEGFYLKGLDLTVGGCDDHQD